MLDMGLPRPDAKCPVHVGLPNRTAKSLHCCLRGLIQTSKAAEGLRLIENRGPRAEAQDLAEG